MGAGRAGRETGQKEFRVEVHWTIHGALTFWKDIAHRADPSQGHGEEPGYTDGQVDRQAVIPFPWPSTHRNCTNWEKERKIMFAGLTLLMVTSR